MQRRIPEQLYTRAQLGSYNADTNTIEVVFATERPVRSWDWDNWEPFNEVLVVAPTAVRMERMQNGAPFLKDHRASLDNTVGVVTRAWIDGSEAKAEIRLSENPEHAGIIADLKAGMFRNVSVGYKVHKYEKQPRSASETLPTYRATDWEPMEVSLVAIPADPSAQVRSESGNSTVFITNEEDKPMSNPTTNPPVLSEDDLRKEREAGAKAERERQAAIRTATRKAGLGEDFAQKFIDNGANIEQVREAVLDEIEKRTALHATPNPSVAHVKTETGWDRERAAIADGLALRLGDPKLTKDWSDQRKRDARVYAGQSLLRLAERCLEAQGIDARRMDKWELIDTALGKRSAYGNTSSDFPVLLANLTNTVLINAYETAGYSWDQWTGTGSVSNFNDHYRVMKGMFGKLDRVDENKEFKRRNIPDGERQKVVVYSHGNIVPITRAALINDDLGAFTTLAADFGEAIALSIEEEVYRVLTDPATKLLDNDAFISVARGNEMSSGAYPTAQVLHEMRLKMARQTYGSGKNQRKLNIRPTAIVAPIELGQRLRDLIGAEYIFDETGKFNKPNFVKDLVGNIVDTPWLEGNAYYLIGNRPPVEVTFLDGNRNPRTETRMGFEVDGMEIKIAMDFGVNPTDFRNILKNPGASGTP